MNRDRGETQRSESLRLQWGRGFCTKRDGSATRWAKFPAVIAILFAVAGAAPGAWSQSSAQAPAPKHFAALADNDTSAGVGTPAGLPATPEPPKAATATPP